MQGSPHFLNSWLDADGNSNYIFIYFALSYGQRISTNLLPILPAVHCLQPALLYIVPTVIGFLAAHCIWNGDVKPVSSQPMHSCF